MASEPATAPGGGYYSDTEAANAILWSSITGGAGPGTGSPSDGMASWAGAVPAIMPDESGHIPGTLSYDMGQIGAPSGQFDSETQKLVKGVENSLKTLWNPQTMTGSQADFEAECSQIAVAYVKMFSENATDNNYGDNRSGRMCYQWQTLTYNALAPIVQNSNYFQIERVGLVTEPFGTSFGAGSLGEPESYSVALGATLQHNWVAISTAPAQLVWQRTPPGRNTVYFDPWIGNGAVVFRYTGSTPTGYEGNHPIPNYIGTPYGADPLKPVGTEGYYTPPNTPPGGVPILKNFPGWTW